MSLLRGLRTHGLRTQGLSESTDTQGLFISYGALPETQEDIKKLEAKITNIVTSFIFIEISRMNLHKKLI